MRHSVTVRPARQAVVTGRPNKVVQQIEAMECELKVYGEPPEVKRLVQRAKKEKIVGVRIRVK